MNDQHTTLAQCKSRMAEFVAQRSWQPHHTPKNLAMSIGIEAAELMELFQWDQPVAGESEPDQAELKQRAGEEMSDVLAYLLSLANHLDIDLADAFERKMQSNERKYPPPAEVAPS